LSGSPRAIIEKLSTPLQRESPLGGSSEDEGTIVRMCLALLRREDFHDTQMSRKTDMRAQRE